MSGLARIDPNVLTGAAPNQGGGGDERFSRSRVFSARREAFSFANSATRASSTEMLAAIVTRRRRTESGDATSSASARPTPAGTSRDPP